MHILQNGVFNRVSGEYIAHRNEKGETQSVEEHSLNTAEMCRDFAIPPLKDLMYVIGLFHDYEKYSLWSND